MMAASDTQREYDPVLDLLRVRTGLSFAMSRYEHAASGIQCSMARAGVKEVNDYRALIENDANALDDLIIELTVGETYFFRDVGHFEFVRQEVLPKLFHTKGDKCLIRVWSAGCASGEEAYSLAMLFEQEGLAAHAQILATDISRRALAKARRAMYGQWSLRGEGAGLAKLYLSQQHDRYVVDERVRRRVAFEYLNLAQSGYPALDTGAWGMDLIFCRNVLIYFDPATIRRVARRLFASLVPGGWLVTGPSDPLMTDYAPFEVVTTDAGMFYRRDAGQPALARVTVGGQRSHSTCHWIPDSETDGDTVRARTDDTLLSDGQTIVARTTCELTSATTNAHVPREVDSEAALIRTSVDSRDHKESTCGTTGNVLAAAHESLLRGDYECAIQLTRDLTGNPAASALHVRALANLDCGAAERACADAMTRHQLSCELLYLHAVLLSELGRDVEAVQAIRRVLYLDRSLALAHFTLGSILRRAGKSDDARRAYRNARDLARARPVDESIRLSDGDCAAWLAEAADSQLALLEISQEDTP
jgi:chemotaxis protein methyltransferase CheR